MFKHRFLLTLIICVLCLSPHISLAQGGPIVIRDTEIENIMQEWLNPLVEAAGLGEESINLILVQNDQINAFVAGGANMFFYTGLLQKTENPEEIIGVMAHELGHIAGGHLIAGRQALERASYESIIGTVLGLGAAILTGEAGAAAAISAGGNSIAARRFLAHSRLHESAADQAALTYLEKTGKSAKGLKSFLEKLGDQELIPTSQQSEYVRTHPITSNRIEALETRLSESPHTDKRLPEHWYEQHARLKAKLIGYINPGRVPWEYSDQDTSIAAQYARTIAAYRENKFEKAMQGIDTLLAQEPANPYFLELKGQILFDYGRIQESVEPYEQALKILPDAHLIRVALAHALIETNPGDDVLKQAINHLERALDAEQRSSRAYRLLAGAYGRIGNDDMSRLALAEEAVLQRRYDTAKQQAERVLNNQNGQPTKAALKAQDILTFLEANNKT